MMEPMALGSSPSSPVSPGINPNFLPGFLMGVDTQPIPPNPTVSPGRNRISGNYPKAGLCSAEPRSFRQKLFNQTLVDSPTAVSSFTERAEKTGPPKTGLFDSFEQKKRASPIMSSTVAQMNDTMGFNESISRVNEDSMNYSRMGSMNESRIKANGINSSRGERVDSHWVTVFGFPPSALTLVLSQLANFGPIADKKVPPHGNWVHVKYNNLSEVAKALSLNCKLINNSIMIGVALYYNREDKENEGTIYSSPIGARSLRHSFISPSHPNSVDSPQILPQKSTGIVTKAMEYVFGW